jgi:hypothetical protein
LQALPYTLPRPQVAMLQVKSLSSMEAPLSL